MRGVVTTLATQSKGAFAADNYQGNIGRGVLKRFVATFDYGHQSMYLKPIAGSLEDVGTLDRVGMWFNVAGDRFEVVDVTTNGPADAAGIKPGDHIVAIDGKPADAIPVYDLRRRLRNAAPVPRSGSRSSALDKDEPSRSPCAIWSELRSGQPGVLAR